MIYTNQREGKKVRSVSYRNPLASNLARSMFLTQVQTPVEETPSNSFEECWDFWVAQQLMCKLDTVSSCFDGVCETCHVCNSIMRIRWQRGICWRRHFQVFNFTPMGLMSSVDPRRYLPVLNFTLGWVDSLQWCTCGLVDGLRYFNICIDGQRP